MKWLRNYPHSDELEQRFGEYLKGKSVAIVGRAGIWNIEQGEFIDSHDVVVRTHCTVPYHLDFDYMAHHEFDDIPKNDEEFVPKRWHTIVGRKTNILYHRFRHSLDHKAEIRAQKILTYYRKFEEAGGKFWCYEDGRIYPSESNANVGTLVEVRYLLPQLSFDLMREHFDLPVGEYWAFNKMLLSGTRIVDDILSHDVKKLYITGFPCYFEPDQPHERGKGKAPMEPYPMDLQFLFNLQNAGVATFDSHMKSLFEKYCTT